MDEDTNNEREMTEKGNSEVEEVKQAVGLRKRLQEQVKFQLGLKGWVGYTAQEKKKELVMLHKQTQLARPEKHLQETLYTAATQTQKVPKRQQCSVEADFSSQEHQAMPRETLSTVTAGEGMLLPQNGYRSEMLLNILECTEQPSKNYLTQNLKSAKAEKPYYKNSLGRV